MTPFAGGAVPISWHETPVRRFRLKTGVDGAVSATAYIRNFNLDTLQYDTTTTEFTVYSTLLTFAAEGEDEDYYGEYGYAVYFPDSNRWEIIQLDCDREQKA